MRKFALYLTVITKAIVELTVVFGFLQPVGIRSAETQRGPPFDQTP